MKLIILSFLFLSIPSFANDALNSMKLRLQYGVYHGLYQGNHCTVSVTTDDIPTSLSPSTYTVYILNFNGNNGHYGLWGGSNIGGRGDCPIVQKQNYFLLRVQNTGSSAPCFSHPERSNQQGLLIEKSNEDGKTIISTLNSQGNIEATCKVTLPYPN